MGHAVLDKINKSYNKEKLSSVLNNKFFIQECEIIDNLYKGIEYYQALLNIQINPENTNNSYIMWIYDKVNNINTQNPTIIQSGKYSMPDIDMDFEVEKREEIIAYIKQKYGEDRVAQIITFQNMKGARALSEVFRAYGKVSHEEIKRITKNIIEEHKITDELQQMEEETGESSIIKWCLENRKEQFKDWCIVNEDGSLSGEYSKEFEMAIHLEGVKAAQSKHAAGIVISPIPLEEICPLILDTKNGNMIGGLTMNDMESIGLVKMDILGLNFLDKMAMIHRLNNDFNAFANEEYNDRATWDMISSGKTCGVFQFESQLGKSMCKKMMPNNIYDLSALNASLRPGPMESIKEDGKSVTEHLIKKKNKEEEIQYIDNQLAPILKNTYGEMIYQEQALSIAKEFAGFSLEKAEVLRKCITGDTYFISNKRGFITINELEKTGYDNELFLIMSAKGQSSWKKIDKIWSNGQKKVYTLITRSGIELKCTANHKILTNRGWQKLKNINKNDYIVCSQEISYKGVDNISKDLSLIIAGIITEGYFTENNGATFVNYDKTIMSIFSKSYKKYFNKINNGKNKNVFIINKAEKEHINKYLDYGKSSTKKIPDIMMRMSLKSTKEFLSFIFATEGCCLEKTNQIELVSKSKILIRQIQLLLMRFGVRSYYNIKNNKKYGLFYRLYINDMSDQIKFFQQNLHMHWPKYKKDALLKIVTKNRLQNYTTNIIPSNIVKKLVNEYKFVGREESGSIYVSNISKKRFTRLAAKTKDKQWIEFSTGKHQYVKVKDIIENYEKEEVYDFTMSDNSEPYIIANGIIIHNSIGKKKPELMAKLKNDFIEGVKTTKKIPLEVGQMLFDWIEKSQRYSFNKCLHPETMVELASGEFQSLKDLSIGNIIKAPNGLCKVLNIYHGKDKEMVEITTEFGKTICCSLDHKFLTENGNILPLYEILDKNLKIIGDED